MKIFHFNLCVFLLLAFSHSVTAVEKVEVQGLFSNKAVLLIDGRRHILAVGEVSPEGVKVVSANSKSTVLEVDGKQKEYLLGNTVSTSYTQKPTRKETVFINSAGMYTTFGTINGRSVRFLIDTGAAAIAMSAEQAKQLGIRYIKTGVPMQVSTASGYAPAYRVRLKSVGVGLIKETNVEAFVIEGSHPGPVLLGMSFLGRLDIQHKNSAMTITQK